MKERETGDRKISRREFMKNISLGTGASLAGYVNKANNHNEFSEAITMGLLAGGSGIMIKTFLGEKDASKFGVIMGGIGFTIFAAKRAMESVVNNPKLKIQP